MDTATIVSPDHPADPSALPRLRTSIVLPLLLALAAILQQSLTALDCDVSWLLTVGERLLDGERLYIDIFEVNPPASVLIYLPAIVAARALGIAAELATGTLVFALAALSFVVSGRLLESAGLVARGDRMPVLSAAIVTLLILPAACFAQREHIALLTLLPMIAVQALRGEGRPVGLGAAIVAGVGAGVTMAIKPYFVLAVAPLILFAMWRRRSLQPAFGVETFAAAAVVLGYVAAVAVLYPAFFSDALPLVNAVYVPSRAGLREIWLSPAMLIFFAAVVLTLSLLRGRSSGSTAIPPLLAAAGFAAAAAIQGRAYINHVYPAAALALFALALAVIEGQGDRARLRLSAGAFVLLAASGTYLFGNIVTYPALTELVRRVAPERPGIIVAGSNLSVGHPLTRWVDGRWAGRRAALWASGSANDLLAQTRDPAARRRLEAYKADDRRIFVEDVVRNRPDVVLAPGAGLGWIRSHPDVAAALGGYRRVGGAEGVHVLLRETGMRAQNLQTRSP